MTKPALRPYSRYSREAVQLLGRSIRRARIEKKLTVAELATRAGLSRGLMQRIEQGDPGCGIGPVFETAAIVGIRLFEADQAGLSAMTAANDAALTLLPRAVRPARPEIDDDF
ncbi:MAG: helix-turn-helix transcriptional regulator [Alphaproteobacteria bacterium]|nr:helix-turn-helix transcriptional regulator [Alphaproteobacteria bacterium]